MHSTQRIHTRQGSTVNRLISATLNICVFQIWTVLRRITFAILNFTTSMYEYLYTAILENVNLRYLTFAIWVPSRKS